MTAVTDNPWDACRKLKLIRGNHFYPPQVIDPGVNYFVLMLEQLGCTPIWSCEGHPEGFHVTFHGPEHIARTIAAMGIFTLELQDCCFCMTLDGREIWKRRAGKPWPLRLRNALLRVSSDHWTRHFGDLRLEQVHIKRDFVDPRPDTLVALRRLIEEAKAFANGDDERWYFEERIQDAEIVEANAMREKYARAISPAS